MDGQANKRCKHGTWRLAHPPPISRCQLVASSGTFSPAPGPLAWDTCFPTTTQLLPPHCFPSSLLPLPSWPRTPKGPSSPSAPSLLTAPLPLPSSCQPLASLPPPSTLPPSRKSEFVVEVKSDKLPRRDGTPLRAAAVTRVAPGDQVGAVPCGPEPDSLQGLGAAGADGC